MVHVYLEVKKQNERLRNTFILLALRANNNIIHGLSDNSGDFFFFFNSFSSIYTSFILSNNNNDDDDDDCHNEWISDRINIQTHEHTNNIYIHSPKQTRTNDISLCEVIDEFACRRRVRWSPGAYIHCVSCNEMRRKHQTIYRQTGVFDNNGEVCFVNIRTHTRENKIKEYKEKNWCERREKVKMKWEANETCCIIFNLAEYLSSEYSTVTCTHPMHMAPEWASNKDTWTENKRDKQYIYSSFFFIFFYFCIFVVFPLVFFFISSSSFVHLLALMLENCCALRSPTITRSHLDACILSRLVAGSRSPYSFSLPLFPFHHGYILFSLTLSFILPRSFTY